MIDDRVMKLKLLKKKVSLTLDEDIIEMIKVLAEVHDRSLSQYINLILKEYISKYLNNTNINFKYKY